MAPFRQTTIPAHLKHPGQPTAYKPEYCDAVLRAMRDEGLSLTAFAGVIDVDPSSVYEWIRVHPAFSHAVARARASRVTFLERKLLKSKKGAETSASIFALRNACPQEWQDKRVVEQRHSVDYRMLSDEQLHALAAGASLSDIGIIEGEVSRVDTPALPTGATSLSSPDKSKT